MKHNWKTRIACGAALTLLAGVLTIPAMASASSQPAALKQQAVTVTLNGMTMELRDAQGNLVQPIVINGTAYLPVTYLGETLGLDTVWNAESQTITLTSRTGAAQNSASYIGEAKAKEIALSHAGLNTAQVTFLRAVLDYDDGRAEYDVEFWSGSKEYDYEIDAATGTILSYDADIEGYTVYTAPHSSNDIGAEQAKAAALAHAGLSSSDAVMLYTKLDWEDGRRVYEVEFYSGNREYDYEIDAATGAVLSCDFDAERYTPASSGSSNPNTSGSYIGEARAKELVEQRAGTTGTYREFHLERDDGRMVYEGELRSGRTEYEFQIDAVTGAILEWETDRG